MAPEVFALLKPLVDVQPAWNLMPVVNSEPGTYPAPLRAFAIMKLRECIKSLRSTADALEEKLDLVEPRRRK